jgi:hypothetical protein
MKFVFTLPLYNLRLRIIFLIGFYILGTDNALTQQSAPCTDCPSGPYSNTCNNCFVTTVKKLTCNCLHNTYEYKLSSVIIDNSTANCNEFTNCEGQLTCGACPAPIQGASENKKEKKNRGNNKENRSYKENESESSSDEEITKKKNSRKKTKRPEEKPNRKKEEL